MQLEFRTGCLQDRIYDILPMRTIVEKAAAMSVISISENGIEVRLISTELLDKFSTKHAESLFDDKQYFFRPRDYYSCEETNKICTLKSNLGKPFRLNFGAYYEDKLVGWSWGIQESAEVFYMVSSAVLLEHQRKGIYSRLVTTLVKEASGQGFQIVYSRHVATNNAVLIPKLKASFTVAALELSDQYGLLIHLRWYANPLRRKMAEFRAGGRGPDAEIKSIFGRPG